MILFEFFSLRTSVSSKEFVSLNIASLNKLPLVIAKCLIVHVFSTTFNYDFV